MNDERMPDQQQDLFLVLNVVDLFEANDFSDWQHFEREVLACRSMPRQNNTSKSSCSLTKIQRYFSHSPTGCYRTCYSTNMTGEVNVNEVVSFFGGGDSSVLDLILTQLIFSSTYSDV